MTIDEITSAIIKESSQFKKELRAAVLRAKRIGELLMQAKAQMQSQYGAYGVWLKEKAKLCPAHACNCIAIAKNWDRVEQHGVDISVKQAADVARGRPPRPLGGAYSVSIGRLMGVLEERVAEIVLKHPDVADIVDAIHSWRERLMQLDQLEKRRGQTERTPGLSEKIRKAHAHGYTAKQIHAQLQEQGVELSYERVRGICCGGKRRDSAA